MIKNQFLTYSVTYRGLFYGCLLCINKYSLISSLLCLFSCRASKKIYVDIHGNILYLAKVEMEAY